MKILWVLILCLSFFSCSDIVSEGDEDPDQDGGVSDFDDRGDDDDNDSGRGFSAENLCEGEGYILYSQGECPDRSEEEISPEALSSAYNRPVDILFVLDTSLSMYPYLHHAFFKRFKNFISVLDNLNWRMLFTDASYSDSDDFFSLFDQARNGQAMRLEGRTRILDLKTLDPQVPDYSNVFLYTITREPDRTGHDKGKRLNECQYPPHCQGMSEKPLRALHASFKANKHLTREDADFIAVIASSTDENAEGDSQNITAEEVITEFKDTYGDEKRLLTFNLIVLPGDTDCALENNNFIFPETTPGNQIAELAQKTGGGNFSICLRDYSVVAEQIVRLTGQ